MNASTHVSSFLVLALFLLNPSIASAQELDVQACRALADLRIADTNLLSAVVISEGDGLPEHCRVLGYVRPAINFEIRLPTTDWNGKFYMAGCGGACGYLETGESGAINSSNHGLRRNYAVVAMDAGHWGNWYEFAWAYHNRQAEIDWSYRAVHETARVTKTLISAFYGREQEHAYFDGCSTGGRMANMAAYRYPEDFDGIISGAPGLDYVGITGVYWSWLVSANTDARGEAILDSTALKIITESVYETCDEVDGLKDGLIDDPRQCNFNPYSLACTESGDSNCLTNAQIEALRTWYSVPKNSAGEISYTGGLSLGAESRLSFWLLGDEDDMNKGLLKNIAQEVFRYLAFEDDPGPSFTIEDFDLDKDLHRLKVMASIMNSDIPNIDSFRTRGGKLLMWHGWEDAAVPPLGTISYYEAVEQHVGDRDTTQAFLRLFMIPGMTHCGVWTGHGIDSNGFDPLFALERWVEKGIAPESLSTTKRDENGEIMWVRPVCPYPQRVQYVGQGDTTAESSFECVEP